MKHWTAESDLALIHKLGFDFIAQLEKRMDETGLTQAKLAHALGISEGAVSKMLNNPQNLTLKTIAKYSKALGIKAAIIAYDDDDPKNQNGLISAEIFTACWQNAGKPRDFWSLQASTEPQVTKGNMCRFVVSEPVYGTGTVIFGGYVTGGENKFSTQNGFTYGQLPAAVIVTNQLNEVEYGS